MSTKATYKCFICGKVITEEDLKTKNAVTSTGPGDKPVYVCISHHRVND